MVQRTIFKFEIYIQNLNFEAKASRKLYELTWLLSMFPPSSFEICRSSLSHWTQLVPSLFASSYFSVVVIKWLRWDVCRSEYRRAIFALSMPEIPNHVGLSFSLSDWWPHSFSTLTILISPLVIVSPRLHCSPWLSWILTKSLLALYILSLSRAHPWWAYPTTDLVTSLNYQLDFIVIV